VVNLADALRAAVKRRLSGVLNVAGSEYLTRLRFSLMIATHYQFSPELIDGVAVADLRRRARRPLRAGLDVTRARNTLVTKLLSPEETFSLPTFIPR
jgi:dTDP-4-dehydrorhamnose reductase